jgi:hypothetical protein
MNFFGSDKSKTGFNQLPLASASGDEMTGIRL